MQVSSQWTLDIDSRWKISPVTHGYSPSPLPPPLSTYTHFTGAQHQHSSTLFTHSTRPPRLGLLLGTSQELVWLRDVRTKEAPSQVWSNWYPASQLMGPLFDPVNWDWALLEHDLLSHSLYYYSSTFVYCFLFYFLFFVYFHYNYIFISWYVCSCDDDRVYTTFALRRFLFYVVIKCDSLLIIRYDNIHYQIHDDVCQLSIHTLCNHNNYSEHKKVW